MSSASASSRLASRCPRLTSQRSSLASTQTVHTSTPLSRAAPTIAPTLRSHDSFSLPGDGNVSIPEFAAFMLGRQDLKEELRFAPGAEADAPAAPAFRSNTEKGAGLRAARQAAEAAAHADLPYSMTRNDCYDRPLEWGAKPLTPRQHGFVSRMEASVEARRHRAYLNELSACMHTPQTPILSHAHI